MEPGVAGIVGGDTLVLLAYLLVHTLEAVIVCDLEVFEGVLSCNEQNVVVVVAERDLTRQHTGTEGDRGDSVAASLVPKPDDRLAITAHAAVFIFVRETQSSKVVLLITLREADGAKLFGGVILASQHLATLWELGRDVHDAI